MEVVNTLTEACSQNNKDFVLKKWVKIKNYENEHELSNALAVVLSKICVLQGVKSKIDQIVGEDVVNALKHNYSDLSIEEIYKAFQLDRLGEYGVEVKHYDLFDLKYFSKIIRLYKTWKQGNVKRHKPALMPPKEEITEEMNKKAIEKTIMNLVFHFQHNENLPPGNYIFVYDYLRKIGKIKQSEGEERERILKKAKENLKLELELRFEKDRSARKKLKKIINNSDISEDSKFQNECKLIHLTDYFIKLSK